MTLGEFLEKVEVQSCITYCYFDEEKGERVNVHPDKVLNNCILFMYVESDELIIEVGVDELP